ncbi:MAG TPA: hypothetical protein VH482_09620 [Thermomicrobiales bacterium]
MCAAILASVLIIGVLEFVDPNRDTSAAGAVIANVINTLVGLIAGFLAGRTSKTTDA